MTNVVEQIEMKTKDLAHKKGLTAEERQKLIEETVKIGEKIMPKFGAIGNDK